MYGMTILAPSINFPVDGFGCQLVFCWDLPVERTVGWWLSCRTMLM